MVTPGFKTSDVSILLFKTCLQMIFYGKSNQAQPLVTEPRILMKAGAYSDSLTVANGDPLMRFCIVLLSTARIPQNIFEHQVSRFGQTIVDPFAIGKKTVVFQMFSTHWFVFWFIYGCIRRYDSCVNGIQTSDPKAIFWPKGIILPCWL